MKIAILSRFYDQSNRGVENWAKSLKENISSGFEIFIFTSWQSTIGRWIRADIVIPTDGRVESLVCRIATILTRKKMIVFGHSGPGADDKWNLLCSPNVFVAFSTHQKSWAEKFKLPWTKVITIPHAIDLKKFMPAEKKPGKNVVLCVAANTPAKRIDLVKKAVGLVLGATFMAVGKGNPIEAGFNEMPEIYKKADVFCFTPNPWEAFGLVFLEALASNLPVVTTDDTIRREIVGNAGIFVDNPEDSKKLAEAIEVSLKIDWKDKPRKQAENFSWEKIRIKYEELFKSLI